MSELINAVNFIQYTLGDQLRKNKQIQHSGSVLCQRDKEGKESGQEPGLCRYNSLLSIFSRVFRAHQRTANKEAPGPCFPQLAAGKCQFSV